MWRIAIGRRVAGVVEVRKVVVMGLVRSWSWRRRVGLRFRVGGRIGVGAIVGGRILVLELL
jgi:hypothetical protein